ncbi:MAG: GGDEF domain-containing protein [Proteobacteria bacterium]|nr:GGDEF domain-containing protein [Pseudomonadota bacterium]
MEKILIISDTKADYSLFEEILDAKGFSINGISPGEAVAETILADEFTAVLADFDQAGDRVYNWIELLQKKRSKSCFILYGENGQAEKIAEILQAGAYGFVPRSRLSKRAYDTILGGMENRKAFTEILAMMSNLRDANENLKREKVNLNKKNQELSFINRLSNEVAYDLNWDRILARVIDAGLLKVIPASLLGLLYRIGDQWRLSLLVPEKNIKKALFEMFKKNICKKFFTLSGERISTQEISIHLCSVVDHITPPHTLFTSKPWFLPLSIAEKPLGMLVLLPADDEGALNGSRELTSTISNILAMSLKNAQEYHKLKEMAVKDVLTGVYNRKGLDNFIRKEFQRARRYQRPLSLVMTDINNFKAINDTFGHQAGDFVLRELAGCLKSSVRQADIVARYGGDEFAILLPDTEMEKAEKMVKRVLATIKHHFFVWESERIMVKISCGISTSCELVAQESEKELFSKADARLYQAKHSPNLTNSS